MFGVGAFFLGLILFLFYTAAFFFKKKKWVRKCLLLYCKFFIYSNRRGLVFFFGSYDIDIPTISLTTGGVCIRLEGVSALAKI